MFFVVFFFFKQKTAYELRISDWSSDVCSSDLEGLYDRGHVLRRDADTTVRNLDVQEIMTIAPGGDIDAATGRGKFDRVGEQIDDDLLQIPLIAEHCRQVRPDVDVEHELFGVHRLADEDDAALQEGGEVNRRLG